MFSLSSKGKQPTPDSTSAGEGHEHLLGPRRRQMSAVYCSQTSMTSGDAEMPKAFLTSAFLKALLKIRETASIATEMQPAPLQRSGRLCQF